MPGFGLDRHIEEALTAPDGIEHLPEALWKTWASLYDGGQGFPYDTPERDGVLFVASRARRGVDARGGALVTYSPGHGREEKYSRDTFNQKTLYITGPRGKARRKLFLISNEAPLLRPPKGRLTGVQRIHADLIAASSEGSLVVIEAKAPKSSADPLSSALLQSYAYAFFLSCHLANRETEVLSHADQALRNVHKGSPDTVGLKLTAKVEFAVMAQREYFEVQQRTVGHPLSPDDVLRALRESYDLSSVAIGQGLRLPDNPSFAGFLITEFRTFATWQTLQDEL